MTKEETVEEYKKKYGDKEVCAKCGGDLYFQNRDYYCKECCIEYDDGEGTIEKRRYELAKDL